MRKRIFQEFGTPNFKLIVKELIIVTEIVGNIMNLDCVSYLKILGSSM